MSAPARPLADETEGFEEPVAAADELLVIDVEGFEGPLDFLLKLARDQKVDLTKISILALAEQYLVFIEAARRLRLELAADYLVMAAWLAYLKSRLLLPPEEVDEGPSGEELAALLAARLHRLEAIRDVAARLMARPQLQRDCFARGMPEALSVRTQIVWEASIFDLLSAYGALRLRGMVQTLHVGARRVFSLPEARERLVAMLGSRSHWAPLDAFLLDYLLSPELKASARASALSASLELVREGDLELRQSAPFEPLFLRRRPPEVALTTAVND